MNHHLKQEFYRHLKQNEAIFNDIQASLFDNLWFWNPKYPTKAWYSDSFWERLGFALQDVEEGKILWNNVMHPDDQTDGYMNAYRHLDSNTHHYDRFVRFFAKDGSTVWMRSRAKAIHDDNGQAVGLYGLHTDVTALKQQENHPEQKVGVPLTNSSLGEALLNNEDVYILTILREGTYSYASPSLCRDLGLDRKDIVGQSAFFAVIPEDQHKCVEAAEFCFANLHKPFHTTLRKIFRDGTIHVTRWEFIGLFDSSGQVDKILGIGTDITERAEAEAQRDYLTSTFESAEELGNLGGWDYHVASDVPTWTHQVYNIYGIDSNFSISTASAIEFYHPDDRLLISQSLTNAISEYRSFDLVARLITSQGELRWVRVIGIPNGDGKTVTNVRGIIQDITDQKNNEITLQDLVHEKQALVEEKEVLLKEIHHRVKNNLQVVASLLSLQARNLTNKDAQEALKSSYQRMLTMASVHKALYESKSLSRINFKVYLQEVVDKILKSIGKPNVNVLYDLEPVILTIEDAVPCGLIINEFVTNALKHAFPADMSNPRLTVHLSKINDMVYLKIIDNGIGISMKDVTHDKQQSAHLGLTVAESLTTQLNATLDILPLAEGGTAATLQFVPQARGSI